MLRLANLVRFWGNGRGQYRQNHAATQEENCLRFCYVGDYRKSLIRIMSDEDVPRVIANFRKSREGAKL